jgi:DNA invertase Pin-like site-specific DNA recombinase
MKAPLWGNQGHGRHELTFEDLEGLRAEGYIRDSDEDQRNGFGPDMQRHSIQRFAESYGLVLGDRWYTEFITGRSVVKRNAFRDFLNDAHCDAYDVLLVEHTSRFGRNQEESIRYKREMYTLDKVVVFVSQGIISGTDRDFINERINETIDEQYSRNLSGYVARGTAEKASHGLANGVPPLGYRLEMLRNGRREGKSPTGKAWKAIPKFEGWKPCSPCSEGTSRDNTPTRACRST